MPITPKHNLSKGVNETSAGRQFTDREEFTEAFRKRILQLNKKEYSILSYYGVGGIGKSTLRKELGRILTEEYPEVIWSCTDFELQPFREAETSLFHLKKDLREKYRTRFPTFDIAYTVYWQKTHPQVTIAKDNIPFLEDGSIVSDLIANAGGIPIVGLLPSIAKTVYKGRNVFKSWWTKRGQKELYDLPSLSPKEILDRLPMYFALDLRDHLQSKSSSAVIFIDTYEALWENFSLEGGFFLRDEWIRELVAHLPEVQWVIFGREKLRWNELDKDWDGYIEQHLLGGLSESDSARFLNSCGITDSKIQKIIIASSRGIPYYLDLAVDTFMQIKHKYAREPVDKDFAKDPKEVLSRFLRYLDKSEIETLKVLSVARYWNRNVFSLLVNEYKTGYPVSAMNVLCRFSFVDETAETETFVLHDLMKQGLQEQLDSKTKESINKLLFENYREIFKDKSGKEINDEDCSAFKEAFYHGKNFLSPAEFQKWFLKARIPFDEAAKWKMLSPLFEELANMIDSKIGKNTPEYAFAITYFSSVLYNLGEYKRALELIEHNLGDLKSALAENENLYASLLNNLATIYYYRGEIQRSKEMYEQVIELRRKNLGENHRHYADAIDNLAVIFNDTGNHQKAIELHKIAAAIYLKALGDGHVHYADALNNLASAYQNIQKYDDAIELYIKALKIVVKSVGKNHPRYASGMSNLARAYFHKGETDSAVAYNNEAYRIRVELLGENHPQTALTLSYMGDIYFSTGEYEKSIEMHEKAAEIYRNTVGESHFHSANCLYSLAECYLAKGALDIALEKFKQAEELYIKIYGNENSVTLETQKQIEELNRKIASNK